jgi:hypothetical protein
MTAIREPILKPVPLKELRPTQITIGLREVAERRKRWQEKRGKKKDAFLGCHMIPVVLGPKDRHYVIDHHHLARALIEEDVKEVLVTVVAHLDRLEEDAFWIVLDNRGWMHPFDADGRRRHYSDIPKSIDDMVDDPYRSLAGALRRAGGYSKETTPFSEFLWADFLRRRIKRRMATKEFQRSLIEALRLSKLSEADYLPGWCGPVDNGAA